MAKFYTIKFPTVASEQEKFYDAFNASKCRDINIAKCFVLGLLALNKKRFPVIESITSKPEAAGKYAKAGQTRMIYHAKWNEEKDNIVNQFIVENAD